LGGDGLCRAGFQKEQLVVLGAAGLRCLGLGLDEQERVVLAGRRLGGNGLRHDEQQFVVSRGLRGLGLRRPRSCKKIRNRAAGHRRIRAVFGAGGGRRRRCCGRRLGSRRRLVGFLIEDELTGTKLRELVTRVDARHGGTSCRRFCGFELVQIELARAHVRELDARRVVVAGGHSALGGELRLVGHGSADLGRIPELGRVDVDQA
jgi:hypothetical protein